MILWLIGFWFVGFVCGVFFLNYMIILANKEIALFNYDTPIGDSVARDLGIEKHGKD